jgi:hypothetical protein
LSSSGSTGSASTAHERERRLADQHLVRRGRLLQPRRDVHRVAGREPLLGAGHDLAGVDTDPPLDPQLRERVAHLDRRAAGAQRVVLVSGRHAEDGHHGVADELLDRAAMPLDDRFHPLEVAREQCPQRLGVGRLAERRRADHVAEEDRDDLPVHATIIPRARHERKPGYCGEMRSRSSASKGELGSTPSPPRRSASTTPS